MKAIRYRAYGPPDVLELQEVGKPEAGDDEVLIRVRAASVNPGDWHLMRGSPYIFRAVAGLTRPKAHVLGFDLAGQVEAVGKDVTKFQPGDEVYGVCKGAFAEYVTVPEGGPVARKPAALTYEEAAAVPTAGLTALQGVRDKAQVGGRKVLVNGASGGVGTFAVQLAKVLGAEVTAVCSGRNADLVRSIGADHVIDYTKEDFTRSTQKYDLILDNIANRSLAACRRVLAPRGTFVHNSGSGGPWVGVVGRIVLLLVSSLFVRQKLVSLMTKENADDLAALGRMLESRDITPVIDRTYRLSDVPDAVGYLERGHARGKVVITL
ncbi:NAD(P)-dependent alcohol dehydrogenase [Nonomuraea sp. KC401]|uniref:NAD(P)-dependent alcohol dehydrogenase n=1 Tax=unclassified Nonomuraea TaxID=2593643 RepID=UPI0010FEDADC|nr:MULTISPECIES: NAD(P)-dependent alcohol dehydrogenase [unclassified Nonomuraea]NBE96070.1 zinc-binding dehydrogenase [Nonomuraea sp. K271]TLF80269.1 NAD(P)-dependent alcohol dehydrogenase [Nonomuraea sp. KC401]